MKTVRYAGLAAVVVLAVCAAWSNATPSAIGGTQIHGAACNCSGDLDQACNTFSGANTSCVPAREVKRCMSEGVPTSTCTKTGDGFCGDGCNVHPDAQDCK
jgi:hypothetical protein